MIKAIPLSIVIASIALPMWFATRPRPRRSLRRLQLTMVAVTLLWVFLCIHVYPQYVLPK